MTYAKALHLLKHFDIGTMNEILKTTCPQDWFLLHPQRLKKLCTECLQTDCRDCWQNEYKGEEIR